MLEKQWRAQPYKLTKYASAHFTRICRTRSRDRILSVGSKASRHFNDKEFWGFNRIFRGLNRVGSFE